MLSYKKKWQSWTLPSKLTAIGVLISAIGVIIGIISMFLGGYSKHPLIRNHTIIRQNNELGANIGIVEHGAAVEINVLKDNEPIPPEPITFPVKLDPCIISKKTLNGAKIIFSEWIDFNGNKSKEEIVVLTKEDVGYKLFLLKPSLGSFGIAFSKDIITYVVPDVYIVQCEDSFEKILVSRYPYGCVSCVYLDYLYFYQKRGEIHSEIFSIQYEDDLALTAESITLPTSMQGNAFSNELKCIEKKTH